MRYCENCGAVLNEDDRFCRECGTEAKPTATEVTTESVTESAASKQETSKIADERFEAFMDSAKDVSGKAVDAVKVFASGVQTKVDKEMEKQKAQREAEKQQQLKLEEERKKKEEAAKKRINSTSGINQSEMWSWLKKAATRKHYYTEDVNPLTVEEFAVKVQTKLDENHVPAAIEKRTIEWDRSGLKEEIYGIKPLTNAANPLSCLLQFCHIGKFSFVEEKTFITPPDLPEVPGQRKELDPKTKARMAFMLYGIIAALAGLILMTFSVGTGLVCMAIGVILILVGYSAIAEQNRINAHNETVRLQEIAWEKAWNDWQNNIFLHSFQEDINGQVSRIFEAAFECIEMVCDEEFQNAPTSSEKESVDLNNLEELIARRKKDYR
ncbi:MAG: zinc ribbon domain-containing protein [Fusicatenibacter sp.]